MAGQASSTKRAPAYDDAKRYAVTLARVVEHEGFTLKPGPEPVEMTGAWANAHVADIAEARELPDPEPHPEPQAEVHEVAEV